MKLTDEQIASILTKDSVSKTILVDNDKVKSTIEEYEKDGWKLYKQTETNGRTKLTFVKIVNR